VFVSLVLIYAVTADQLDKDAGVAESDESTSAPGESH